VPVGPLYFGTLSGLMTFITSSAASGMPIGGGSWRAAAAELDGGGDALAGDEALVAGSGGFGFSLQLAESAATDIKTHGTTRTAQPPIAALSATSSEVVGQSPNSMTRAAATTSAVLT